ncbi:sugar phosphate isomerase/epimerase family protein [Streptococcus loxodontisalivarius]|uniref:Sugar phosphate isomerase/epimerase n=1 Tax=Streptococcus loxodontisalivarius TaxID=1349415 RepID=A0ABS2PTT2_9STRE|nr:TIM barrel protein [Streptococcus loxodontisalivarius]MBM7643281.1 sugar phosphate isomerase/epimerase [Streptococcus loxodontisalivarius]
MVNRKDLIINSIAFLDDMNKGQGQVTFLDKISELGLHAFEVRREFLKNGRAELEEIRQAADQKQINLYFSVNEDLILNDKINPLLETLFEEAEVLGAPFIKLNTGDASKVSLAELETLKEVLEGPIGIRLENNQTPGHASLANCKHITDLVGQAGLPISFVFDTANWIWLDESIEEAREQLESVTSYLHCKNYQLEDGQPRVANYYDGLIDIEALESGFSHLDAVAFEYPASFEQLKADVARYLG